MMHNIVALLIMLAAYYATFGIMAIGFGMMLAGSRGASTAGRFFFVRPLQWAGQHLCLLAISITTFAWTALLRVITGGWTFFLHGIVDPPILAVERAVMWLVTRDRSRLRGR